MAKVDCLNRQRRSLSGFYYAARLRQQFAGNGRENVYTLFGKSGLFAFNRDGEQLWHVDLGQKSDPAKWGDGSSPIVVGDLVIVDAGVLGNQFVGINKTTGEKVWSINDPGFTNCWSTPTELSVAGQAQILFNVPKRILAIDPLTGKTLWTADSPLDDAACGSIVTKDEIAYLMGSRAGRAMAVKCDGLGDVSQSATLWQTQIRSGIGTPLIVGENMYWTSGGIFFAASLSTGEYVFREHCLDWEKPPGLPMRIIHRRSPLVTTFSSSRVMAKATF